MIVTTPADVLRAYGADPHWFAGIRGQHGGWFNGLLKKFGESLRADLICGKTFKLQHKGVTLYDVFYQFPFELDDFERQWKSLLIDPMV